MSYFTQLKNGIVYLYSKIFQNDGVQVSINLNDTIDRFWFYMNVFDNYFHLFFTSVFIKSFHIYNNIQPFVISLCIKACRIYNLTNDYCIDLYNTNETIKSIVNRVQYNISLFYSFLINRKSEPQDSVWFCASWTTSNYSSLTKYYNYNEEYLNFFTNYFCDDLFNFYPDCNSGYALKYIESVNSYIEQKPNSMFPLIMIKTTTPGNKTIYSVRKSTKSLQPFVYSKSKIKFICIEYVHKEMSNSIEIKLEEGYYISGNELFTPTFVLRLLEYQSNSYFFDENYKIRIMDSECKIIEFGFESYLLLTENGYEIIDDETITSVLNKEEQISRLNHQNNNSFISTWLTGISSNILPDKNSTYDLCKNDSSDGYDSTSEEEYNNKQFILSFESSDPSDNIMSLYTSFEFGSHPLDK